MPRLLTLAALLTLTLATVPATAETHFLAIDDRLAAGAGAGCTFEDCRAEYSACLDGAHGIQQVHVCQLAFETCRTSCDHPTGESAPACFLELPGAGLFERTWFVRPEAVDAFRTDGDALAVELTSGSRVRLALDADTFLERLRTGCAPDDSPDGIPAQGFVGDLLQGIGGKLAQDQERVAAWIASLLLEAGERGFLTIDHQLADAFANWLAEGLALVTRPDLTVEDLVDWVTDGVDLIRHHREALEG